MISKFFAHPKCTKFTHADSAIVKFQSQIL